MAPERREEKGLLCQQRKVVVAKTCFEREKDAYAHGKCQETLEDPNQTISSFYSYKIV